MRYKDIDVSDDNIFLQQVMEKHGITVKQLAMFTGRAAPTIYKYLSGDLTIPSIVWRSIFERTADVTIFNLFIGSIPCSIAPLVPLKAGPNKATLASLLTMRKKQIAVEGYVLRILADGEIDESDNIAIANYRLAFPDMVSAQTQIFQAIIAAHNKQGVSL